jgi:hypothetical protein
MSHVASGQVAPANVDGVVYELVLDIALFGEDGH